MVDRISPIPLLLIHGERDAVVPLHHAEQLCDRARAAGSAPNSRRQA